MFEGKISVIVPVHNKQKYLKESISSVLCQEYSEFELILIDDASTDNSYEILKSFTDDRIKILRRNQPGPGGYAARNLGVKEAQGDWVCFLDADDEWTVDHLKRASELITKYPEEQLINFAHKEVSEGKEKIFSPVEEGVMTKVEAIELFSKQDIIHTNSILIKKFLFDKTGGFPAGKYKMGGDAELWLRLLLESENVVMSNQVTSIVYRDRGGIITNPNNKTEKHPLVNSVENYLDNSTSNKEKKALKNLSNRKSLSWSLDRKRYGSFNYRELGYLYPSEFKLRDWLRCIVLLMPKVVYRSYHKMMYGFH